MAKSLGDIMSVELATTISGAPARRWKPYPVYKDSGVEWLGEVPDHWKVIRLKFIAKLNMGQSPASEDCNLDGEGTPFLQGNAEFGQLNPTPKLYCSTARKHAQPEDFLLSVRAPVGALNVADQEYGIGRGLCAITPQFERLEHGYALYLLEVTRNELYVVATGSTYEAVTVDQVGCINCILPPLHQQHTIASFLDRQTAHLDALISKKERLITLLEEKRAALISRAVTKGLDPDVPMKDSGVEWLGEVPEEWKLLKLKHIAKINLSNVDKKINEDEEHIKLCNYVDVYYNDYITSDLDFMEATASPNQIDRFALRGGDVIITKDSESWEDIAVPAYVSDDLKGVICGYHLAHIRPDYSVIDGEYLFWSLCAPCLNHQFRVEAHGITRFGLEKYCIDNSQFLVPPINEQKFIASFLDRETAKIDVLIDKIKDGIDFLISVGFFFNKYAGSSNII
jgi:type I restriction enzyme S subunit